MGILCLESILDEVETEASEWKKVKVKGRERLDTGREKK